jgi:HAD superfamily hydrolase (TIGR01509 family)
MIMRISTFIFDFDGTILDTESQDFVVVSEMWQAHGHTLAIEEWRNGLGTVGGFDPYEALEAKLGQPIDRGHWRTINHERYHERVMLQSLRPGVLALFDYADTHHITLAVGSSADRAWVTRWLTHHQLIQRFAAIVTRDDVAQVKPSPEIFLTAANAVGTAPETCVVFEDSAHGATAAARASMRCVAVPIPALVDAWMPPVSLRLRTLADLSPSQLVAQLSGDASSAHTA